MTGRRHAGTITVLTALLVMCSGIVGAQQSAQPRFSVASVKRDPGSGPAPELRASPDSFAAGGTLAFFLRYAYGMSEVSGGPQWAWSDIFDLRAKSEAPVPLEDLRAMLRVLLTERFDARVHVDRRTVRGYALVVKGQLKLRLHPGEDAATTPQLVVSPQVIVGRKASLKQLAAGLSSILRVPVDDNTNATGTFDFEIPLDSAAMTGPGTTSDKAARTFATTEFSPTALKDFGLALISTKLEREVLVLDSAKKPSEN